MKCTALKRSLRQGYIFRSVCKEFCPRGGACMAGRGCAWQEGVGGWDMHGCWGDAWLQGGCACLGAGVPGGAWQGDMHGGGEHAWLWGACVIARGHVWLQGVGMVVGGWHVWFGGMHGIRQDTVNERAVRIPLECILVISCKKAEDYVRSVRS